MDKCEEEFSEEESRIPFQPEPTMFYDKSAFLYLEMGDSLNGNNNVVEAENN